LRRNARGYSRVLALRRLREKLEDAPGFAADRELRLFRGGKRIGATTIGKAAGVNGDD